MPEVPPNVQEFNTIAGLIFAQLYGAFPIVVDIDRPGIARAMGVSDANWGQHKLASGRTLNEVLAHTIAWLAAEEYMRAAGSHPAERVTLTSTGLATMNVTPSGLNQSVGAELKQAADKSPSLDLSRIGDLIGGIFGGFTKSIGSG